MSDDKRNVPMDNTMPEGDTPDMYKPADRNTYAMDQLIKEVEFLFPGIGYEVNARNKRGVAFDIQFDLTSVLFDDRRDFCTLLELLGDPAYNEDVRILTVVADMEGVLVSFRNNPVIQDDPTPFGLAEAWSVLRGGTP